MAELKTRIDSLEARLAELKARKARIDARKRTVESRRERKEDARRKILLGATLQQQIAAGAIDNATVHTWLDTALARTDDRALFGLPPRDPSG
jgi:prefoldin subunit 5